MLVVFFFAVIEHGVTFRAEDLVSLASVMATPTSPPPEPRPIHPPAHHAPRDEGVLSLPLRTLWLLCMQCMCVPDPIPVVVRSSMDALAVMARVDDAPINFRYFGIAPSNSMGWWVSRIHVPPPGYPFGSVPPSCRPLWLGTYSTPHIAAWVYDAAVRLLGLASTLPTNFISRTPPQHVMDSTRDKRACGTSTVAFVIRLSPCFWRLLLRCSHCAGLPPLGDNVLG